VEVCIRSLNLNYLCSGLFSDLILNIITVHNILFHTYHLSPIPSDVMVGIAQLGRAVVTTTCEVCKTFVIDAGGGNEVSKTKPTFNLTSSHVSVLVLVNVHVPEDGAFVVPDTFTSPFTWGSVALPSKAYSWPNSLKWMGYPTFNALAWGLFL
jgi:hypothetical protein